MGMHISTTERETRGGRKRALVAFPGELAVAITAQQQARLFREMGSHPELQRTLHDRALRGPAEALAQVARAVESSRVVALALGDEARARAMEAILARMVAAGVEPEAVRFSSRDAHEGATGDARSLPITPDAQVWPEPEAQRELAETFTRTKLRRGRARNAKSATKRAWSAKSRPRADQSWGIVQGDAVFTRGDDKPNDERSLWLNAGVVGKREWSQRMRAEAEERAQRGVKDSFKVRCRRAQEHAWKRHEVTRPDHVAMQLLREDVLAGRFAWMSPKWRAALKRYLPRVEREMQRYDEWVGDEGAFFAEDFVFEAARREDVRVSRSNQRTQGRARAREATLSDEALVERLMSAHSITRDAAQARVATLRKSQRRRGARSAK